MLTIRESIQKIVKGEEEIYSLACTVDAVDETARTIDATPTNGDAQLFNVKLQSSIEGDKGFVMFPEVGSAVIVTFTSKDTAFVSLSESISKVLIDCEEITFNGGTNGGTTNTPTLRTELNKTIARLTALEVAVAAFAAAQQAAAIAAPPVAPLIPGYAALTASISALPLQGAYNTNIEDTKIKH